MTEQMLIKFLTDLKKQYPKVHDHSIRVAEYMRAIAQAQQKPEKEVQK